MLNDPLVRAKYMLNKAGYDTADLQTLNNPALLRMELEEQMTMRLRYYNMEFTLQRLSVSPEQGDYHQVKENIVKLQFWQNIQQAI
ncbi:hypothetical protein [Parasitella parasitica]|uniref:Uncharacterized protein n=1 Tax=Parasitella parasitica TaxID=35722 RepID=A0A0B7N3Q7_9FUNG|nr:hypothetical protein [Parasitella parasitica]